MDRRTFAFGLPLAFLLSPSSAIAQGSPSLVPVVKGLDYPWGLAFLPDGTALVTERSGTLRRIDIKAATMGEGISGLPQIDAGGQGGLLGIAVDPDFANTGFVFMSYAQAGNGGNATAVFRARLSDDMTRLVDGKIIFTQNLVVQSQHHFGSRLVFGRDGHLYVTTGDRGSRRDEAQNPASHLGKVLRITKDGAPAPGNPNLQGWAPEVWSIGHRNVQGATLHPETGLLWTAEHGAKGGDEINIPQAGKNYGWPVITYGEDYSGAKIGEGTSKDGLEQPLHYWNPSIAPSGMAFITSDLYPGWKGSLLVGALSGAHISRLTLEGTKVVSEERLFDGFARFRDVVQGPDGHIFALVDDTSPDGGLYMISAPGDVTSDTGN
jgi:aldose sugar dehydrogenase